MRARARTCKNCNTRMHALQYVGEYRSDRSRVVQPGTGTYVQRNLVALVCPHCDLNWPRENEPIGDLR